MQRHSNVFLLFYQNKSVQILLDVRRTDEETDERSHISSSEMAQLVTAASAKPERAQFFTVLFYIFFRAVNDTSRPSQNSLNESPPRKRKEIYAVVDAGNDRFISFAAVVSCVAFFFAS